MPAAPVRAWAAAVVAAATAAMPTASAAATTAPAGTSTGPSCASVGIQCRTGTPDALRDSVLDLTEIVWLGPETKGFYVGSPSVWRLPGSGELVASHDFFGASTVNSTVQVFIDRTGRGDAAAGAQWEYAGNVSSMYWANLFTAPQPQQSRQQQQQPAVHRLGGREPATPHLQQHGTGGGANGSFTDAVAAVAPLYLLGVSAGDASMTRSIVISRSDDKGVTWSVPSVLVPFNASNSYHCAPTPTLVGSDGRLYRAFEDAPANSAMVLSTREPYDPATTNLLDPAAWVATPPLPFDQATMLPSSWTGSFGWQEGNAIEQFAPAAAGSADDAEPTSLGIVNILRLDHQTTQVYNKAMVTRLEGNTAGSPGHLVFDRVIDFPSTGSKFVIRYHAPSATYYSLSTDVTAEAVAHDAVYARNHLSLVASQDLYNWTICDTILDDDTGFAVEDTPRYTGFHYVDWVFDDTGNATDLLATVRTGYRGSNSYHNANRMTFKRVTDFVQRCAEPAGFRRVGNGWCRPANNFTAAGTFLSKEQCAQACRDAGEACQGFANGFKLGCALYPDTPTASSEAEPSFSCHAKVAL